MVLHHHLHGLYHLYGHLHGLYYLHGLRCCRLLWLLKVWLISSLVSRDAVPSAFPLVSVSSRWFSSRLLSADVQSTAVVMISVELWRARIGMFNHNNKRCSGCSLLSSSSLASSHCHRQAHHGGGSTDVSQEEPSSAALTSPSSNTLATKKQSQEFSSTDHHSTSSSTSPSQSRTAQLTLSCSAYGSSFMASSFSPTSKSSSSSFPSSRDLHRSLLREAVITLLIAIISQLLMIAGDIETNPGPKHEGENEPACICISVYKFDSVLQVWFILENCN